MHMSTLQSALLRRQPPNVTCQTCGAEIGRATGDSEKKVKADGNRLRLKSNFMSNLKLIWVVQSLTEKYFAFHF